MGGKRSLKVEKHKKYFERFLQLLPKEVSELDSNRVTIAYFCLSGLDLIQQLDSISLQRKREIIQWVYSLQIINDKDLASGFEGSPALGTNAENMTFSEYRIGYLAATYCALNVLLILGNDLSAVNRKGIIRSLKILQTSDGCFTASKATTESDMRFVYCACAICYILNDWSSVDKESIVSFILKSLSHESAFGQLPGLEAHGGSTYCAVASLAMMNRLDCLSGPRLDQLIRWLLFRQTDGFQGRPNKPADTCYAFWVGAALKLLGAYHLVDTDQLLDFVLSTQSSIIGGFSKWTGNEPDPLHSYMGISGLSLMRLKELDEVVPTINISHRAHDHLKNLHRSWEAS